MDENLPIERYSPHIPFRISLKVILGAILCSKRVVKLLLWRRKTREVEVKFFVPSAAAECSAPKLGRNAMKGIITQLDLDF